MAELFLGIDGGQSSTTALIAAADGTVLGRGTGGPCNHVTGPEARAKFLDAVGGCLRQACDEAGLAVDSLRFRAACLGFSGGAEDKEAFARELIRSDLWKITHDAEIALTGAVAGEAGIMVIAGTGSMAFGRNAAGATARAGGWGYLFGDEGGALYLVRQALRACLRHEEGWGEPTILTALLLGATGAASVNQLLHDFYATPRSRIASHARLLDEAARLKDETALSILSEAGGQLAGYVAGVHRNIFNSQESFRVSYTGGTFQNSYLLQAYGAAIKGALGCAVTAPVMNPAAGAVLEALKLSGSTVSPVEVTAKLSSLNAK